LYVLLPCLEASPHRAGAEAVNRITARDVTQAKRWDARKALARIDRAIGANGQITSEAIGEGADASLATSDILTEAVQGVDAQAVLAGKIQVKQTDVQFAGCFSTEDPGWVALTQRGHGRVDVYAQPFACEELNYLFRVRC